MESNWHARKFDCFSSEKVELFSKSVDDITASDVDPRRRRCAFCGKMESSSRVCDLCERLCGRAYDHSRTERNIEERFNRAPRRENATTPCRILKRGRLQPNASVGYVSNVVRWNPRPCRWGRQRLAISWMILFLSLTVFPAFASAQKGTKGYSKEEGVCQSLDIRNNVKNLEKNLRGCRVVEGYVQILLMDNTVSDDFENISFPELKEITGHLLFYRVTGLRNIGRLFPNLTVIRGQSLLLNYALVAFEMMDLQEIGLHNLISITRGAVRFEKNPVLCFVSTIDWDLIGKAGKGDHVIAGNSPKNACPVCEKHCPQSLTNPREYLCWNQQHCQRICERKCENNACDENGTCCNVSCLGTCTGPTNRDCSVCKDVLTTDKECTDRCPNGTVKFMNYRCITEDKCLQMRKPREAFNVQTYPYKPFDGLCTMECPSGYMDDESSGKKTCKKCEGLCQKQCLGNIVDSIAAAQRLRGCTQITGGLEIEISGGKNIVKELEDNLSTIEEIDGYLKIARSFPLISLNFLKNLRVIKGTQLQNSEYSLLVMDNQNLQELWDWNLHKEIKILRGKIFFHLNPKLCLYKIDTLREKTGLAPFTDYDVSPNSNGDKVACNLTELMTRVSNKSPTGAVIEWEPFIHHDDRSLLGYVVYFIEAPNKTVTMYDGRDACGGDGWKVDDVSASSNRSSVRSVHSHYLSQLKPYTQYAYYVKTYTIATERFGGQSKLTYFRTRPTAPSSPRSLNVYTNSSTELIMSWLPPLQKNGNLTHYKIFGKLVSDDPKFIDQRNYCEEPILLPDKDLISNQEERGIEEEKEALIPETGSCECSDREIDQSIREKEATSAIAFEDAVHNTVYVKRRGIRSKREALDEYESPVSFKRRDLNQTMERKVNGTYEEFERVVPSTNHSFIMKELRHFSAYNIEIQACRAPEVNDPHKLCSAKSMRTYRTLPMASADDIPPNSFELSISGENNSLTTVTLKWDEPPKPNGLIITYQIEYKRIDIQNYKPTVICITRRDFANAGNSYVLKEHQFGKYSVKVRATSLAGYGAYTQVKYFTIEERNALGVFWLIFWLLFSVVSVVLSLVAYYVCKRKYRERKNMTLIATVNPQYVSTPYVLDEWEVPREKIKMLKSLGKGTFGMVYEGIATDIVKGKPEVRCAVKTVNKDASERERIEFLNEASVMKGFDAHHVVKLLGVVTRTQPTLVIMELMVNGDLKKYLRNHRLGNCENITNVPPKLERILQMAIEIADGMAYLSTKKFVHRDLAARNCMVADDLTVKVGDFGMTRDIYERDYYKKESKGLLPVRWMAPESLKDGVFSSYSDVWSYGVVLWEMVTLASQPYQGLSNEQVLRFVIDGRVMERPENCPELLYELMKRTWKYKPDARPSFMDIATMLLKHIDSETFKEVSFYHSADGIEIRNQNRSTSSQIDQHLELTTLQDLREEEAEGEEDSPLRQDFGEFASSEPSSIRNSFSPHYRMDSYGESSKATSNFHDLNWSNAPLKAGFDDFDGVSTGSITSPKDALNLPFVEDSLKSVKSSPFGNSKSASKSNLSQLSLGNRSGSSPKNPSKRSFLSSPISSKLVNPDYENGSPEVLSGTEKRETVPLRVDFRSMDTNDTDNGIDEKEALSSVEYMNKPESLNNGYIDGTAT
ncbi:insulin-like receptor [Ceratina calcarata]|uniref:Insulin-like receptor n=1 Tax=Ceratina calcarata TaxID=156304 RepID=A0AAJ7IVM6_9HYME|nr:insulin-like receptor [Ceratina calcarata]